MKMKKQQGFTLIELVIVITIIGLLAAVALPRFVNLQREARIAKLNSVRGSVSAAAALIHAAVLTKNSVVDTAPCPGTGGVFADNTTTICTESGIVAIVNAYPATTAIPAAGAPGIVAAAGLTPMLNPNLVQLQDEGYNVTVSGTDTNFQIQGASNPATCQFIYTQAVAGAAPGISAITNAGC